jgi:hypothetical protein
MVIRIPKVGIFFSNYKYGLPYLHILCGRGWFLPVFLPEFLILHMKTNSNYLPLFFLCWAFLYTPLALLRGFPSEAKERNAIDAGNLTKPGICRQAYFAPVNAYGVKPFSCFDAASFLPEQERFGDGAIGLMDKRRFAYGFK